MMNRAKYFEAVGHYFGYPQCCIDEFIHHADQPMRYRRDSNQEIVHQYSGFIPCKCHAKEIVEGKSTLESILTNRQSPSKFPEDNSPYDQLYIQQLKEQYQ